MNNHSYIQGMYIHTCIYNVRFGHIHTRKDKNFFLMLNIRKKNLRIYAFYAIIRRSQKKEGLTHV